MLTLALAFLLALTLALAFALFLSERLSAPLLELAAATRAVAQGDFSRRHPVYRRDELGMLTSMFNRMTQQLDDARQLADENHRQLEAGKLYLESILANLSAGVIAFDAEWQLRASNISAGAYSGRGLRRTVALPFTAWAGLAPICGRWWMGCWRARRRRAARLAIAARVCYGSGRALPAGAGGATTGKFQ